MSRRIKLYDNVYVIDKDGKVLDDKVYEVISMDGETVSIRHQFESKTQVIIRKNIRNLRLVN